MKADPEVKMISAEAPILFAKGCDVFITELTMRAWIHAEENKRRTLQRSDIASALAKSDMFDFLIDIVPREEATAHKRSGGNAAAQPAPAGGVPPQAVQQQQGAHPPPHPMAPPDYMGHQMAQEQDYQQQPPMFAAQVPQQDPQGYGQPPPQMFGQGMYAGYGMPQQVSCSFTTTFLHYLTASSKCIQWVSEVRIPAAVIRIRLTDMKMQTQTLRVRGMSTFNSLSLAPRSHFGRLQRCTSPCMLMKIPSEENGCLKARSSILSQSTFNLPRTLFSPYVPHQQVQTMNVRSFPNA